MSRRIADWLTKLFGCVPHAEREGVRLEGPHWEVEAPGDAPAFLRALSDLVPPGSILCLETVVAPADIRSYLSHRRAPRTTKVAMGTIWPRPEVFHVQVTSENLQGLAALAEHHAEPEVADHLHVYSGDSVIVEWFDAFSEPLLVSKDVTEARVREFCARLGVTYREPARPR